MIHNLEPKWVDSHHFRLSLKTQAGTYLSKCQKSTLFMETIRKRNERRYNMNQVAVLVMIVMAMTAIMTTVITILSDGDYKALAKRYSQLKPSYKIKTCIGGWPNGTAKSSQFARKIFNCLTTTAQSPNNNNLARVGLSWLRWSNGGKRGSSWTKI